MNIQIIENMDGSATAIVDGVAYSGTLTWSSKRVDGVRARATLVLEPMEDVEEEATA